MPKFHYKILGLNENATHEQIKQKYKELSLLWHPDKNLDDQENATKMFNLISEAFQILSRRERRQEYDNKSTINQYKLYSGMDLFSRMFPNNSNISSELNRFHNNPMSGFNNNGFLNNWTSLFDKSFMNSSMDSNMNLNNIPKSSSMVYSSSSSSSSVDQNGKRNIQSKSIKQYIKDNIKYTTETITTSDGKTKTNKYQEKLKIPNQKRITQPPQTPYRR